MDKPRIADTRPAKCRLEAGRTVYWCRCGRSQQQPFCDGSHAGTGFEPLPFTPEQDDEYFLCQCKRTAKPPFCDGSHKRIGQDELDAQAGFRTAWYRLADADELADGERRVVRAGQRKLLLIRIGERFAALDPRCPHRGGPLADAALVRDADGRCWLRCPWHGSDFDPLSGRAADGQGSGVAKYPLELRADGAYVALREPLQPPTMVSDLVVETLQQWGLRQVIAGNDQPLAGLAAAFRRKVRADGGWFELPDAAAAAVAASVFARLSGQPVACVGSAGMWPGLLEAAAARAPVLAIANRWPGSPMSPGRPDPAAPSIPCFELSDQRETSVADTIGDACRAVVLKRAPAMLVLPAGLQARLLAGEQPGAAPAGRVWNAPMVPAPDALEALRRRLQEALRPALIVGDGADLAASQLVDLAESLGAPVLTSRRSKGRMPETHPLAAGVLGSGGTAVAAWCLREADLLLLFGACPRELAGLDWLAPMVQVDADVMQLGGVRPAALALRADPDGAASWLVRHLSPVSADSDWRRAMVAERAAWQADKARRAARAGTWDCDPAALFHRLGQLLPSDALLIVDLGAGNDEFTRYFDCREQEILLPATDESGSFGLSAMIAAWLATRSSPELGKRPVIGLGSHTRMLPQLTQLAIAARQEMRMTLILLDTSGWPAGIGATDGDRQRESLPVAFATLAESCGANGLRVATPSELSTALQAAAAANGPSLVEICSQAVRH